MSEEMLENLMGLIDARIDERIGSALGRDTLTESVRFMELRKEFINVFISGDEHNGR